MFSLRSHVIPFVCCLQLALPARFVRTPIAIASSFLCGSEMGQRRRLFPLVCVSFLFPHTGCMCVCRGNGFSTAAGEDSFGVTFNDCLSTPDFRRAFRTYLG